jgi:transcriptional regulator with GAF, ATPase, and Fis domain
MTTMQNAFKYQEKLHNLLELASILNQQNSYDEILRIVARITASLLEAETALIMMVNPQTRNTIKTVIREGQVENGRQYHSLQNQITGWLIQSNQPLISEDIKRDERFVRVKMDNLVVKSVGAVLLKVGTVILGSLIALNKTKKEPFQEEDLALLEKISFISAPYLRDAQKIQQYFDSPLPENTLLEKYKNFGLLGKSPQFIQLLKTIEAAARCDVRVQLEGESGTGKELIAKAIHNLSARNSKKFIAIDCGTIPENLIESELFGHVKGAFTGAMSNRTGLLEEANEGTLFIDEIANLPMDAQTKLMRFLQEAEIRPVGSNASKRVNVRIISASSQSLPTLIKENKFREDLFYRLHVYPIFVPSLNKRSRDIPFLAIHFLKKFAMEQGKECKSYSEHLLEFMQQREWSGNIRELENFVERLVALAPVQAKIIDVDLLTPDIQKEIKKFKPELDEYYLTKSLSESIDEYEERIIRAALIRFDWHQSKAARSLKIPVQTIHYKMKKLGIKKP